MAAQVFWAVFYSSRWPSQIGPTADFDGATIPPPIFSMCETIHNCCYRGDEGAMSHPLEFGSSEKGNRERNKHSITISQPGFENLCNDSSDIGFMISHDFSSGLLVVIKICQFPVRPIQSK